MENGYALLALLEADPDDPATWPPVEHHTLFDPENPVWLNLSILSKDGDLGENDLRRLVVQEALLRSTDRQIQWAYVLAKTLEQDLPQGPLRTLAGRLQDAIDTVLLEMALKALDVVEAVKGRLPDGWLQGALEAGIQAGLDGQGQE